MKKKLIRFFSLFLVSIILSNCSTYTVKKDLNQKGELRKTPKWYIKYDQEDKKWMYATATSVSPDLELSMKKSVLLAKAKLADRINGKMNNQTTLSKYENGINENKSLNGAADDTIVNIVGDTLVRLYVVDKAELFYTNHKSYRSYVKLKVSKNNVSSLIKEIKEDKNQKRVKNNNKSLTTKAKNILKNID